MMVTLSREVCSVVVLSSDWDRHISMKSCDDSAAIDVKSPLRANITKYTPPAPCIHWFDHSVGHDKNVEH